MKKGLLELERRAMFSLLKHAKSPVGPYPSYYHNGSYMPNPNDPTQDHISEQGGWDQHSLSKGSGYHDSGMYGSDSIMPLGDPSNSMFPRLI